mgnify:FL=1
MAKHKYVELEVDSHNIATRWITRDGIECWATNEYRENGRFKDVHITKMIFPKGYTSISGRVYSQDTLVEFN